MNLLVDNTKKTYGRHFQCVISHSIVMVHLSALLIDKTAFLTKVTLAPPNQLTKTTGDAWCNSIIEKLNKYLDGIKIDFTDTPLLLDTCSNFQRKILQAASEIPYGKTVSYAELASKSGFTDANRAAASVMRNNSFPLIIPCHRVIRTDKTLGGFMGKLKGDEISIKRNLLKLEGSLV